MRIRTMGSPPRYKELEDEIETTRRDKELAIEQQDFERAAALRDAERKLTQKKRELEENWKATDDGEQAEIGEEEIADIVSMWTGIPVFKLTEAESQKLVRMEEELHKRVIGQHQAIVAVSKAIRRARAGIKDPKRPSGSFIFLGPSGVGKTELARTLAEFLFGDEDALIQVDMSEYMEKHAVSRLVGSPPGYIGYDEGGQLTEAVRRKPYSVVLLDEIEKAHPDVFNILLQVLEDGKLTDAQGRKVDFRNTIVIMTSNIGAAQITKNQSLGFVPGDPEGGLSYDEMKNRIMGELKKVFRPELLNRIDEVIVFHKLTREEITSVVHMMMRRLRERMVEHEVAIELSASATDLLADRGLRPGDGRPAAAPRDPAADRGSARRLRPRPPARARLDDRDRPQGRHRRGRDDRRRRPKAREGGRPGRRRRRAGRARRGRRLRRRRPSYADTSRCSRAVVLLPSGAPGGDGSCSGRPAAVDARAALRAARRACPRRAVPAERRAGLRLGVAAARASTTHRGLRVAWRSGAGARAVPDRRRDDAGRRPSAEGSCRLRVRSSR